MSFRRLHCDGWFADASSIHPGHTFAPYDLTYIYVRVMGSHRGKAVAGRGRVNGLGTRHIDY